MRAGSPPPPLPRHARASRRGDARASLSGAGAGAGGSLQPVFRPVAIFFLAAMPGAASLGGHRHSWGRATPAMSDDAVEKTALVLAIESGDVDAVREAVEAAGDADAQRAAVNAEEPGTWHASLHKSASLGDVDVTNLLLELFQMVLP